MTDRKKLAAAVSAVMQYLQAEEQQAARGGKKPLWGLSGRQMLMQARSQMQAKSFYGWKLR